MTELNILFQIFNNLSESEKKAFLRKVKGGNSTNQSKSRTTCNCAYCKSQHIVKFGKSDKVNKDIYVKTAIKPLQPKLILFFINHLIQRKYGENTLTV